MLMASSLEDPTPSIPTWLVTAPNGLYVENGIAPSLWRPFGNHHARQVGSTATACGMAAYGWQLFWDLPFPSQLEVTCGECRTAVLKSEFRKVG
jgi:hypothetical protein